MMGRVTHQGTNGEERAPRMYPARRLPDRAGLAVRQIEPVVAVIGVRPQDAGISCQMRLRILAPAIAPVVEYRCVAGVPVDLKLTFHPDHR